MRALFILAVIALGGFAYIVMAPAPPVATTQAPPAKASAPTNNKSLITSLKRQIADEEDALQRSMENYGKTSGDVTKGSHANSQENRARRAKIAQLRARLATLE